MYIGGAVVKNPPASTVDTRDRSSIPGSGRSPGIEKGNPLQYSCLGNSMVSGAWWATICGVAKSQTWLSRHTHENAHTHICMYIFICIHLYAYINVYVYAYINMQNAYFMKERKWKCYLLSCIWLFATPWAVAHRSSVHRILQARILEWVAISFSRGSSWPRDRMQVSHIEGKFFTIWTTREPPHTYFIGLAKKFISVFQ